MTNADRARTALELAERLMNEEFAIISAERPYRTPAENGEAHKTLHGLLQLSERHEIHPGMGYWNGKSEESYLVFGISRGAAEALAESFDQDAVMTHEGLSFIEGHIKPINLKGTLIDTFGERHIGPDYTMVDYKGVYIKFQIPMKEDKNGN
jgi:hypothetical protein